MKLREKNQIENVSAEVGTELQNVSVCECDKSAHDVTESGVCSVCEKEDIISSDPVLRVIEEDISSATALCGEESVITSEIDLGEREEEAACDIFRRRAYSTQSETTPEESEFHTDIQSGLSAQDVERRKLEGKINGDQNVKTKSVAQILRENLITFFNLVFVVLAVILAVFVDWNQSFISAISNFGFLILVIFNALIGIIQELRAKRTIDKLSLISAPKATVLRAGEEQDIAVSDIVLDDMVVLSSGSQICADAVIVDGSIEVNESLITGEPDAILKIAGNKVMSGSFVVSGKAKAQVEHVGADNFATKISSGAKYFKRPNSEIWRSLMLIVKVMAIIIVPIGIALFCVKYLLQNTTDTLNETVIGVIATVIGMIPNGLVALSSTVFCVSVIRLSKRKILAQDLYCVETLARVDMLCLDKTGTITEGTMEVNSILPYGGRDNDDLMHILSNLMHSLSDDNATANALRSYVAKTEPTETATSIVPFSSARKWSGARLGDASYVMGAPEFVFDVLPEHITATMAKMAQQGFRVIALASSADDFKENSLPDGLEALGLVFITDTIRKEAPDTLHFFKQEGVKVKIISGDNPETVRAVALRAGLADCENIIDMSTLSTEEEIYDAATKYTIFGRVLPDQKLTLVKALKKAGHTVAMTGDGVNDVLALKAADCSIAMASGSDAAKNVSSLVLLDSNFASMPEVVAEGRRSINNLERSAALYLTKTFYNTLLALLFMIVTYPLPFSPKNLTLMGAVTIGIPSIVLALEPNEERVTGRFLTKVMVNAIPGAITVILGAAAVLICQSRFLTSLSTEQVVTMFITITTFVGFMLLAKVSLPFSWLHLSMYLFMIFIFIACYTIPFPGDLLRTVFDLKTNFTWEMGKAMLVIATILILIYIALVIAMNYIKKKREKVWNARFEQLDDRVREKMKNEEKTNTEQKTKM